VKRQGIAEKMNTLYCTSMKAYVYTVLGCFTSPKNCNLPDDGSVIIETCWKMRDITVGVHIYLTSVFCLWIISIVLSYFTQHTLYVFSESKKEVYK